MTIQGNINYFFSSLPLTITDQAKLNELQARIQKNRDIISRCHKELEKLSSVVGMTDENKAWKTRLVSQFQDNIQKFETKINRDAEKMARIRINSAMTSSNFNHSPFR